MITKAVKQSPIFTEFNSEEQKHYFSVSDRKVTNHIDTMYFTVSIYNDSNECSAGVQALLDQLMVLKRKKAECYQNYVEFFGLSVENTRFVHYEYCLRLNEMFDIFISSILPNPFTPRIVVQLRTRALVLDGVCQSMCKAFRFVETVLSAYGVEVGEVKENRIDYAYHTNLIQNPYAYFSDECLLTKLKSKLRKYHKVGEIGKSVDIDYLSFGMRNSNDIFVRIYNKSREVIEKNYKSFFLDKWLADKLISNYDYYVYQKAYACGSYVTGMLIGRIDWYLEYGSSESIKQELQKVKISCYQNSDNTDRLRSIVDQYLPPVTLILNIEYQTKRKFYSSLDEWISSYGIAHKDDRGMVRVVNDGSLYPLDRLHIIYSLRDEICNYLTSNSLCFVENKGKKEERFTAWWQRIHDSEITSYTIECLQLWRSHERYTDIEKSKRRTLGTVAQLSILKNNDLEAIMKNKANFTEDISDVLCALNDNDFYGFACNPETGEKAQLEPRDYDLVKKRKARQYRGILKNK